MAETMPDDSSGLAVERLARSLLACARDQPSLLVRPSTADHRALPGLVEESPRSHGRPALLAPGQLNRPSDRNPYLEELVSIAVSTAHQAENAARRASDACALARRDRFAWAGFGVLGIVIGIAGAVDAHWVQGQWAQGQWVQGQRVQGQRVQGMNRQPEKMASDLRLPSAAQGKADDVAGSAVASDAPVSPGLQATTADPSPRASSTETFEPPLPAAIPIAVRPTWSIDSTDAPLRDDVTPYYPPPRPKYHMRRNHRITVMRRHPVILARFFANLRRDVRSIFQ